MVLKIIYVMFLFHKLIVKMLLETLLYASTPEPNTFQFYYTHKYIFEYEGQTTQIKKTRIYLRRHEILFANLVYFYFYFDTLFILASRLLR